MIQAQDVHVSFATRSWLRTRSTPILRGFTLEAPSGMATGLIGANGSGKTTFFRACAGLVRVQSGRVLVDGVDPAREPEKARALLSILPERPGIPAGWTALDALRAACAVKGLRSGKARQAMEREIDRWAIEPFAGRLASGLSRGQQVRIALACEALAPAPNVILDEPTAGLDFESSKTVRAWARELREAGACLIVSTHIVSEIEKLCQEIAGLRGGVAQSAEAARSWIDEADAQLRGEPREAAREPDAADGPRGPGGRPGAGGGALHG